MTTFISGGRVEKVRSKVKWDMAILPQGLGGLDVLDLEAQENDLLAKSLLKIDVKQGKMEKLNYMESRFISTKR
jgi:hypothetical protein